MRQEGSRIEVEVKGKGKAKAKEMFGKGVLKRPDLFGNVAGSLCFLDFHSMSMRKGTYAMCNNPSTVTPSGVKPYIIAH